MKRLELSDTDARRLPQKRHYICNEPGPLQYFNSLLTALLCGEERRKFQGRGRNGGFDEMGRGFLE